MAAPTTTAIETTEAVIVSGPRKGEFITIPDGEPVVTPEAEALLDRMIETANEITETLQRMRRDADAFHVEMRQRKEERDGLIRPSGRADQVPV